MPEIQIRTDGPYLLDASGLQLSDANGNAVALPEGSKVALCRCGQSENKPFCDGGHKAAGFKHGPAVS
ncbi:MAG: Zn-finger domain of CDGSH type-containing protein [Chloroflexi bacterium]|nr:MAG: Zn-finger domain of CDGSH type-containing protein [Chloroflexota bacterium]